MHRTQLAEISLSYPARKVPGRTSPALACVCAREVKLLPKVSLFQACKGSARPDHLAVEDRALDAPP